MIYYIISNSRNFYSLQCQHQKILFYYNIPLKNYWAVRMNHCRLWSPRGRSRECRPHEAAVGSVGPTRPQSGVWAPRGSSRECSPTRPQSGMSSSTHKSEACDFFVVNPSQNCTPWIQRKQTIGHILLTKYVIGSVFNWTPTEHVLIKMEWFTPWR